MFQSTTTTGDPNHYKFNGKELDAETGLYNFGARYYSPALGRFVTPDPGLAKKIWWHSFRPLRPEFLTCAVAWRRPEESRPGMSGPLPTR
ncbi:MAG TPA: RHS repeat-associated core domain-containing protein [Candidatus Angelobacter sp.]